MAGMECFPSQSPFSCCIMPFNHLLPLDEDLTWGYFFVQALIPPGSTAIFLSPNCLMSLDWILCIILCSFKEYWVLIWLSVNYLAGLVLCFVKEGLFCYFPGPGTWPLLYFQALILKHGLPEVPAKWLRCSSRSPCPAWLWTQTSPALYDLWYPPLAISPACSLSARPHSPALHRGSSVPTEIPTQISVDSLHQAPLILTNSSHSSHPTLNSTYSA